jgi:Gpi18-like mannosyltransferase
MKVERSLFKIGAALAILLSLSWCLYIVFNHRTSNTEPQSTIVQGHSSMNIGASNLDSSQATKSQFQPNGQRPSNQTMSRIAGGREISNGSNYTVQIIVYAITFFLAVLAAYFALVRRKTRINFNILSENRKIIIVTLFCVGFLLRIVLGISLGGYSSDLNLFQSWANSAVNNFSQFYSGRGSSDYPPLYIYVLYVVGKIASINTLSSYQTILLKLPSILADMGTAFLLSKLARKYLSAELSILVAAFYIFNPAVFVNSAIWGQVDSFFTLIVLTGIVLLTEQKIMWSSVFFTAAVLMKPQGIIFLPVLFFELIRRKRLTDVIQTLIASTATALLLILPFSTNFNVLWVVKLFTSTLGEYPYASVNGFNFFYLLGANYTKDASTLFLVSYHIWGTIFIVLTTLLAWFLFVRRNNKKFISAAALILISGVFIFSTRMHERYLFPAVALAVLAFIYLKDRRLMVLAAGFSITSFTNMYDILCQTTMSLNQSTLGIIPILTSALNVLLFIYLLKTIFNLSLKNPPQLITNAKI